MPTFPTRRSYAVLTLLVAAFVLYGSLVPFDLSSVSLDEARGQIGAFLRIDPVRLSWTDFITNVALLIPFGFFLTGALSLGRTVTAVTVILVQILGAGLASAAELSQIFFPNRTPSMVDVFAQNVGNLTGIVGWCLFGPGLTSWLRGFHEERDAARRTSRLLGLLVAGIVVADLLPMDFTVRPAELAAKYREGRILLQLGLPHDLSLATLGDWLLDALGRAPFGILALLGWTKRGRRRRDLPTAMALGWGAVVGVELAQVFVWSRFADAMDVLTGGIGVIGGALAASMLAARVRPQDDSPRTTRASWSRLGMCCWIGCLAIYHWAPFDFHAEAWFVRQRLTGLLFVPFASYVDKAPLDLSRDVLAKLALTLVLGALLRFGSPGNPARPSRTWTAFALGFGALVLTGLEFGQLLLLTRYPDSSDILVGQIGVILGFRLAGLLIAQPEARMPFDLSAPDRGAPERMEERRDVPWQHFKPRERHPSS